MKLVVIGNSNCEDVDFLHSEFLNIIKQLKSLGKDTSRDNMLIVLYGNDQTRKTMQAIANKHQLRIADMGEDNNFDKELIGNISNKALIIIRNKDSRYSDYIKNMYKDVIALFEIEIESSNNSSLDIIENVSKSKTAKTSITAVDDYTRLASKAFDYEFNGESKFYPYNKPSKIPPTFNIGVIVGASGSGKSTLLEEFGKEETIHWHNDKAIISHFENPDIGINKLSAVGLNSIPSWVRPYHVLSTGEKFRAELAMRIKDNAVIDEFTSVVDRNVAKATSCALHRYIKQNDIKGVVFATCHEDVLEWLQPDWVFNTNTGQLINGRWLRQPNIIIDIYSTDYKAWEMFKEHHYLTEEIHKSARCYIAIWNNKIVGFSSALARPNENVKNAWREHRTVVLPDYQGLGIGVRLSDAVAQIFIEDGKRYFSRTAHPRMGNYRDNSELWKKTSKYKKLRTDVSESTNTHNSLKGYIYDTTRVCFSHEYIGK